MDESEFALRKTGKDIGTLIGLGGGLFLGEQINDYIPFLQEAPFMIHAAVDLASMYVSAVLSERVGERLGHLAYKGISLLYS